MSHPDPQATSTADGFIAPVARQSGTAIGTSSVSTDSRLIIGRITQAVPNSLFKVCDIEDSWPNFVAWAQDTQHRSGGKSLGDVLLSHNGGRVVGRIKHLRLNTVDHAIDAVVEVDSDAAWAAVLSGKLRGFSTGGPICNSHYRKVGKTTFWYYTRQPREVSLAYKPRVDTARFQLLYDRGDWMLPPALNKEVS